jgi:RimJ/RimL family protein N-acetyltransferase
MGVNRFTYNMKQAEVDNVIRGESPRGSKGIMTKALEELLRYMYGKLHILEPHVRTRTTNHRALDLYYRCGFQTEKKDNREIELVIPHYQDFKVFDL